MIWGYHYFWKHPYRDHHPSTQGTPPALCDNEKKTIGCPVALWSHRAPTLVPTTGAPHDVCARYLHSDATRVKRPGRWVGQGGLAGLGWFWGDEMMRGGGEIFALMVVMCLGVKNAMDKRVGGFMILDRYI